MTDQELFDAIYNGICTYKDRHYASYREPNPHPYEFPFEAYVDLAKDIGKYKAGTTFRVVLASNMGDLCLSLNLHATHGYQLRLLPGEGLMTNCRIVKMGDL